MCLLVVVGVLTVQHVLGQTTTPKASDELHFKGTEATDASPTSDSNHATDPADLAPDGKNQRRNNRNNNNDLDNDNDYDYDNDQQQPQLSPFNYIFPFGGQQAGPSPFGRPGSLLGGLFGGNLFDHLDRRAQEMERQFSNLERQAGEGQDVSYFQRNGEAYVRTCTTRKVKPGEHPNGRQRPIGSR